MFKSKPPVPVNMTLFGNSIFTGHQVKMRFCWIRLGPNAMTGAFIRKRDLDKETRGDTGKKVM